MSSRQLNRRRTTAPSQTDTTSTDYLEYLADVVLELSEVASKTDAKTLAALLQVAHSEARLQMNIRK